MSFVLLLIGIVLFSYSLGMKKGWELGAEEEASKYHDKVKIVKKEIVE